MTQKEWITAQQAKEFLHFHDFVRAKEPDLELLESAQQLVDQTCDGLRARSEGTKRMEAFLIGELSTVNKRRAVLLSRRHHLREGVLEACEADRQRAQKELDDYRAQMFKEAQELEPKRKRFGR